MTRKKRLLFWGISVAFVLYAVLTCGLVIDNEDHLWDRTGVLVPNDLYGDVSMEPQVTNLDIPFVFHYFQTAVPFRPRLKIYDSNRQYRSIEISEIVVEYGDGEVIRRTDPWIKDFRPFTEYQRSSSGFSQTEIFALTEELPTLVLRHADVTITVTGQLIKVDGQRVAFTASKGFKAKSTFRITTYWEILAEASC